VTAKKRAGPKPEQSMTREEAQALARRITDQLENLAHGEFVADFLLLQRWYAHKATRDDAETVYIQTERDFCVNVEGVESAVYAGMAGRLETLRKGGAAGGK
jgi:hypothetical protein